MNDVEELIRRVRNNTPPELLVLPIWLLVHIIDVQGEKKPRKVPLYADGKPRAEDDVLDSPSDRSKLVTFPQLEQALREANADNRPLSPREKSYVLPGLALGVMPDGRCLSCIDFDDIAGNGTQEIERDCLNTSQTFSEISVSGHGSHVYGIGDFGKLRSVRGVEFFSGKRTIALTANKKGSFSELNHVVGSAHLVHAKLLNGHAKAERAELSPAPQRLNGHARSDHSPGFATYDRKVHDGQGRNKLLSDQAYYYRKKGYSLQQTYELLQKFNEVTCDPPVAAQKLMDLVRGKRNIGPDAESDRLIIVNPLSGIMDMKIPPVEYLLDPLLKHQGLAMIHGYRGLGKTHVSIGIAVAVASGGSFLRWSAPQPQGVLFVDGEMPAAALQERFINAVRSGGREIKSPLDIITPDLLPEEVHRVPDLSTLDGQALMDAQLRDDHKLIILDNLSCLTSSVENEGEGWLPVQDYALRKRSEGRSVLMMHHSGKNGQQRGTSRREDVLDTVVQLRRPSDYSPEQGARFEVHIEKGRHIVGDVASPFEAHLNSDRDGKSVWQMRDLKDSLDDRIVEMHDLGMRPNDMASELKLDRSNVYRRIQRLKHEGRIRKADPEA